MTEILSNKYKDSIKVICRDCPQKDITYYLDGKKLDINKIFITLDNIKNIVISPYSLAIKQTGDSTKTSVINITSKRRLRLWTLNKLLYKNSIDSNQVDNLEIAINDKQIQDTDILIDSKAKIIPVYKRNASENRLKQYKIICGVLIYTTLDRNKK